MKNLKRTIAVFVSAVMVMAMLAGCGGGSGSSSLAKKMQSATGTTSSSSLDKVASEIASGEFTSSCIKGALANNNYNIISDDFFLLYDDTATAWTLSIDLASGTATMETISINKISATEEELLADAADFKQIIEDLVADLEDDNYTVDAIYLAIADAGDNEWIIVINCVATYKY